MGTNVSVERFKKLTQELKDECFQIAHDELAVQAENLVRTMKSIVVVGPGPEPRPGLLRDSIGWSFSPPAKTRATGAFRPGAKVGGGAFTAYVFAGSDEAFYARWVEFGTAPHSIASGADISRGKRQSVGVMHPGARAQPFFWPTYRLMRKSIRSEVKKKLNAAIKKRSAE